MDLPNLNISTQPAENQETKSGISISGLKKSRKKSWIGVLVFVILVAGAYIFYWMQLRSPEIVFLRTILAYSQLGVVLGNGKMEIDSPSVLKLYQELANVNLAQKNLFSEDSRPLLNVNFDFAFDWSGAMGKKEQTSFDYNFFIPGNANKSFSMQTEERSFSNNLYSLQKNIPEIGSENLFTGWVLNTDNGETSRYQFKIDQEKIDYKIEPTQWFENFVLGYKFWKAKKTLAQAGKFISLPSERINGEEVKRIKVEMETKNIKHFLEGLQVKLDAKSSQTLNKQESVSLELWTSKKNYQPKKMVLGVKAKDEKKQDENVIFEVNFQYNPLPQILEPQNVISLGEFSKHLESLAVESEQQNFLGFELFKNGKNQEAEPFFLRALKYNVNNFRTYNSLGLIYAQKGDFDKATEYYKTSLTINPNHDKAAINLIYIYDAKNNCEEQLAGSEDFIKKYSTSGFLYEAYWLLSDAYTCLAKSENAIKASEAALQLDPKNPWNFKIYYNLGLAYAIQGNSGLAIINYQKSTEFLKQHPELKVDAFTAGNVYVGLGKEYYLAGRSAEAKRAYLEAIKYDPSIKLDPAFKQELIKLGIIKSE